MIYPTLSREDIIKILSKRIDWYKDLRANCVRLGLTDGAWEYKRLSSELRWVRWLMEEKDDV